MASALSNASDFGSRTMVKYEIIGDYAQNIKLSGIMVKYKIIF